LDRKGSEEVRKQINVPRSVPRQDKVRDGKMRKGGKVRVGRGLKTRQRRDPRRYPNI
jgi:hypothetical protein